MKVNQLRKFYRYNWSIETRDKCYQKCGGEDSTDTIGVLKLAEIYEELEND